MAEKKAIQAQGFKLEIGQVAGDSPISFTEVKYINSFQGFDGEASEIDITTLQSPSKEFILGLDDAGGLTLELNYMPTDAGQNLVRAAKQQRDTPQDFRATFSDGSSIEFNGLVKSSPITGGVDAKVGTTFNIKLTGQPDEIPA